jgi:plastocyanin
MRKLLALATVTALAAALNSGLATADTGRTVRIQGDEQFVPNAMVMATFRFSPGPLVVKHGDTVTWVDDTPDPHTVTVVNRADLPKRFDELFSCAACNAALAAHGLFGGPLVLVLNAGAAGLDAPGDSLLLGPGSTASGQVTAPSGSTLHYLCAIHPWMQGSITVQ